jgi:hypothetical protein
MSKLHHSTPFPVPQPIEVWRQELEGNIVWDGEVLEEAFDIGKVLGGNLPEDYYRPTEHSTGPPN